MGDEDETVRLDDDARPGPAVWVNCPTCDGSGKTGPADDRPCVMCGGSGLVPADVAGEIADSAETEAGPTGDG